jgi:hypothetical protein
VKQYGDVVFEQWPPPPARDVYYQTGAVDFSRPSTTSPTVMPVPIETRKPLKETFTLEPQDQNQPPPRTLNRHERRRLHAMARQKRLAGGKAPSARNTRPTRPGAKPGVPDPRLLLLDNLAVWAVQGLNEDGTFLAFLAQFKNGHAIVVLDKMDALKAREIVLLAVKGKVRQGFIGMMLPTLRDGKINISAQRNSLRVVDMEKAVQIVSTAVIEKFNKYQETQRHDADNRTDEQPAGNTTDPTGVADGNADAPVEPRDAGSGMEGAGCDQEPPAAHVEG